MSMRWEPCSVVLAAALCCLPAAAQNKAVKCGGKYQDRPCAGMDGRLVGQAKSQKAVAERHVVDPACQRRGTEALPFITARQEGATEDQQLASTTSPSSKHLISEIYRHQGDAAAQRAAVEASCMKDRKRAMAGRH